MKNLLFIIAAIIYCGSLHAQGQTNNSNKLSNSIETRLVELALQNPEIEIADHQIQVAKYHLKEVKGWWLNNISLSFNANEFTVKRLENKMVDGQSYPYYPLYNFSVNIPIGGIFSKPATVRAARENVAISRATRDSKFRQLRADVLSAYQAYKAGKELYALQSQITEAAYNEYLQIQEQFRNGQVPISEFNNASEVYHEAVKNRISAKHNFELTRITLEALIGKPIGQVVTSASKASKNAAALSQKNDQ